MIMCLIKLKVYILYLLVSLGKFCGSSSSLLVIGAHFYIYLVVCT